MFEVLFQATNAVINLRDASDPVQQSVVGTFCSASLFITGILQSVLVLAALLTLAELVIGGINYINSGGEKGKLEAARQKITNSIIGLIVLASTVAIFNVLQRVLGFDLQLTPSLEELACILRRTPIIHGPIHIIK